MTQPNFKLTKPVNGSSPVEPSIKRRLKVALVEDQPQVRESWIKLINSFSDFTCICACSTGEDALKRIPQEQPDVVLMDVFLPRMSGIQCTVQLKELLPKTPIVMLTGTDDQEFVFLALEAGADGYLLKQTKPADLRIALLDVLGGGAPMTSQIARRVIESFRQKTNVRDETTHLSIREEQILQMLSQGYTNKVIADKLELSINTVDSHLKHVYTKLHVRSRTEAVIRYMSSKQSS